MYADLELTDLMNRSVRHADFAALRFHPDFGKSLCNIDRTDRTEQFAATGSKPWP